MRSKRASSHPAIKIVFESESPTPLSRARYASSKLDAAVYKLATGPGTLRVRLEDAFIELRIIHDDDLPPTLRAERRAILTELTRGKMQFETLVCDGALVTSPIGGLRSTLRFIRYKRAEELARRICDLAVRMREFADDLGDDSDKGDLVTGPPN